MRKLSNADIAELLAREAEESEGILQRAFKKAARSAFLWPEQARVLWQEKRVLTDLQGIGPVIAKHVQRWLEKPPPEKIRPPPLRDDFLTLADAGELLAGNEDWRRSLRGDLQMHTH